MKRAVVFAHYDKDNIVDDYVIYYLKAFKYVVNKVIFVSCNNLEQVEKDKVKDIADVVIAEAHDEYDFGSYKRGFSILKNEGLSNYEEIIFANDSCYGPFFPLLNLFNSMEEKDCDYWGITKNYFGVSEKILHVQSYFLVFRKSVFMSDEFINFIEKIKAEETKDEVIEKYEIGLSKMLSDMGYKHLVYIDGYKPVSNPAVRKWKELIKKRKDPFLKCSIPRLKAVFCTTADGWKAVIENYSDYPTELIEKNLARTKSLMHKEVNLPTWLKEFLFGYIYYLPKSLRKYIGKILGIKL